MSSTFRCFIPTGIDCHPTSVSGLLLGLAQGTRRWQGVDCSRISGPRVCVNRPTHRGFQNGPKLRGSPASNRKPLSPSNDSRWSLSPDQNSSGISSLNASHFLYGMYHFHHSQARSRRISSSNLAFSSGDMDADSFGRSVEGIGGRSKSEGNISPPRFGLQS